jgi:hypothetical protein
MTWMREGSMAGKVSRRERMEVKGGGVGKSGEGKYEWQ